MTGKTDFVHPPVYILREPETIYHSSMFHRATDIHDKAQELSNTRVHGFSPLCNEPFSTAEIQVAQRHLEKEKSIGLDDIAPELF